jgi:hypothetical protein
MYVNIIYKSIKSRFNYIVKIIQVMKYKIDEGNVIGSRNFVRSFLGNYASLACLSNKMFKLSIFHLIF